MTNKNRFSPLPALVLGFALAGSQALHAQSVVNAATGDTYATIGAAVAAAINGDTLVVSPKRTDLGAHRQRRQPSTAK